MSRLHSRKTSRKSKSHKSNTKPPLNAVYFLGVSGMTTSSYISHDYTTMGHTNLISTYVKHIHFYTIYLLTSNAIKKD
jgi:uncharacterized membrane protein YadS